MRKIGNSSAPFLAYTTKEETGHSILHGAGTLGAIAGLVLLSLKTRGFLGWERDSNLNIAAALIFSITLIGLFLASTLYHVTPQKKVKRIFRIADHAAVVTFIAGSYTPFCLSGLGGFGGWAIFSIQWFLAITGITLNILGSRALRKVEVTAYIIMGWFFLFILIPLMQSVRPISIVLLLIGGLIYSVGTIWYRMKHIRGTHVIWHGFVLGGAVCHWFSVWFVY